MQQVSCDTHSLAGSIYEKYLLCGQSRYFQYSDGAHFLVESRVKKYTITLMCVCSINSQPGSGWVNLHHHPSQLINQASTGSQPTCMKPLSCFVTKSSFCWLRDNTPSVMKWTRSEPYLTGLVPGPLRCTRTW